MPGQGRRSSTTLDPDLLLSQAAQALTEGRLGEAERFCRQILSYDSTSAVTMQLLGLIAHRRGQYAEAVRLLQKSITIDSSYAVWHYNLGVSCRAANDLPGAERAYAQAIQLDPNYAPAHYNLGSVLLSQGHQDQAKQSFQQTLKLDPNHGNACFQLGTLHREGGNIGRALTLLRRAMQLLPEDVEVCLGLGVTLLDAGELAEARGVLEQLHRDRPDMNDATTALAKVYERAGENDSAWKLIEPLLNDKDVNVTTALVFADLAPKRKREQQAIQILEARVNDRTLEISSRMFCHFALGRLFDKLGDADRAFDHFKQANDLKSRWYDPAEHERHVDAIIKAFDADALMHHPRSSRRDDRPVFIVGMPRSGTSLVEQILTMHADVVGGGELPYIANLASQLQRLAGGSEQAPAYPAVISQLQLNEMARVYLGKLDTLSKSAQRITDKTPTNFLHLGLIALMLPGARIIHCRRDPMASCWSCYIQNFVGEHAYSYNLEHLGLYYQQYQRIMDHWRSLPNIPMLEVDYERLVTEPEPMMRELVAFCGLPWTDDCLRFHENPRPMPSASYDQVRQPMYTSSIDRWRRYETRLSPLRDALNRTAT